MYTDFRTYFFFKHYLFINIINIIYKCRKPAMRLPSFSTAYIFSWYRRKFFFFAPRLVHPASLYDELYSKNGFIYLLWMYWKESYVEMCPNMYDDTCRGYWLKWPLWWLWYMVFIWFETLQNVWSHSWFFTICWMWDKIHLRSSRSTTHLNKGRLLYRIVYAVINIRFGKKKSVWSNIPYKWSNYITIIHITTR